MIEIFVPGTVDEPEQVQKLINLNDLDSLKQAGEETGFVVSVAVKEGGIWKYKDFGTEHLNDSNLKRFEKETIVEKGMEVVSIQKPIGYKGNFNRFWGVYNSLIAKTKVQAAGVK